MGLCQPCYLQRDYVPCGRCGRRRHRRSSSGLCHDCYWNHRRAGSPFTGLTTAEYDAQRYDPEGRREAYLRKKYGLTQAQYDSMRVAQGDACALCRTPFSAARLTHGNPVVDHCHETGQVRGLLCDLCNKGLGQFRDRVDVLARAIDYLNEAGEAA